ncbi:Myb-like dna-binding protein [Globisporangium polare]
MATMTMTSTSMVQQQQQQQQPSSPSSAVATRGIWSLDEHDRFLRAMKLYPKGPWKAIADHIATRSVRQVQTHAQKYQEKVSRRLRGLRKSKKKLVRPEHRIDDDTMELCKLVDSAAEKLVCCSSPKVKKEAGVDGSKEAGTMSPADKKTASVAAVSAMTTSTSVLELEAALKADDLEPLPDVDFDNIELDPVHFPTVSESLDFLIEYLSV